LERNERDFRPESYRPVPGSKIEVVGHIDTKRFWEERKRICLKKVYDNLAELIAEAKNPQIRTSREGATNAHASSETSLG
jgi:hypothetical protein